MTFLRPVHSHADPMWPDGNLRVRFVLKELTQRFYDKPCLLQKAKRAPAPWRSPWCKTGTSSGALRMKQTQPPRKTLSSSREVIF